MGNTNLPKFIIEYSQNGQHFKKAIAATNRERELVRLHLHAQANLPLMQ